MAEYIEREALMNEIHRIGGHNLCGWDTIGVKALVDRQPTADVVEVRHGYWKHTDLARHWVGKDECSECTYHTFDRRDLSQLNYCPNCGAKMDGDKK